MKTNLRFVLVCNLLCIVALSLNNCNTPKTTDVKPSKTNDSTIVDKTNPTEVQDDESTPSISTERAKQVPLTLVINNLASANAPVVVGLYGTSNKFPDPNDQLKEYKFKPHGKTLTAKIPSLKFGTYALAIYQDVNDNGKIDKNFIGRPTEPYAFSNNYKPTIKAPGFDNCKFSYDAKANTVTMNMIK